MGFHAPTYTSLPILVPFQQGPDFFAVIIGKKKILKYYVMMNLMNAISTSLYLIKL